MRRKIILSPYFLLGFVLLSWMNLPRPWVDGLRNGTVASLAPTWKWAKKTRQYLSDRPQRFWHQPALDVREEVERLQLENQKLRAQLIHITQWMESEQRSREHAELLQSLVGEGNAFLKKKAAYLRDLLKWEWMAIPAQVIYRDPASWSSSLWVSVGEEDNRFLGHKVIAKNSPVVAGAALVGVVDYVGDRHSRIRLVTDAGLSPAVRAVRGALQQHEIIRLARELLDRLQGIEGQEESQHALKQLQAQFTTPSRWEDLARGELHGSSSPFWRSRSSILQGIGFHCDAMDPGEGQAFSLKEGDLLVTSGLDGVFPPDLLVGKVTKIHAMRPGGYAFDLEARPAAVHLNDLQSVFILPALRN